MKLKRKLITIAISFAMIVTSMGMGASVFAAESDYDKGEAVQVNGGSEALQDIDWSGVASALAKASKSKSVKNVQVVASEANSNLQAPTAKGIADVTVPAKGALIVAYASGGSYPSVWNSSGTELDYVDFGSITVNGGTINLKIYSAAAGTYTVSGASSSYPYAFMYAKSSTGLSSGKAKVVGNYNYNTTSYFKVKAGGNGIIKVSVRGFTSDTSMYNIKLCNSKKKALSSGWETLYKDNNRSTTFGVKKGTYYLAVRPYSSSHSLVYAIVSKSYKKSVNKAGASKKKAVKIKLKQTKKGLFYINSGKAKWYKLKLKKAKKVTVVAKADYGEGGSSYAKIGWIMYYKAGKAKWISGNTCKLKKGTYYFKVYRTKKANGYYTFKVK